MSTAKYFFIGVVVLFGFIGVRGWIKKNALSQGETLIVTPIQTEKPEETVSVPPPVVAPKVEKAPLIKIEKKTPPVSSNTPDVLDSIDRIKLLFTLDSSKLPFVETLSYTSRVPWLKGRPAWISDYASHYQTSRHFIARSLNKKVDYFSQKIGPGDKFNVFKKDKNIQFHLVLDLSKAKMRFYVFDSESQERILLKTYLVGVGRVDSQKQSGYLTPVGTYQLGDKVAIYKPTTTGFFQDKKTEMIRVFGTRWIPFDKEIEGCSENPKGFGLHGAPWVNDPQTGQLIEDRSTMGKYDSDGCIRLLQENMEEIFAIVITKPTFVHIVKDFQEAKLPGVEK